MNNTSSKGFIKALMVIVIGACVLFLVIGLLIRYIQPKAVGSFSNFSNLTSTSPAAPRQNSLIDFGSTGATSVTGGTKTAATKTVDPTKSPYADKVILTKGNTTTAQPIEEYLILKNSGAPVDITGWTLTNGKGTRPIQNSQNSYFYPTPDSAVIGQGTEFLDPSGTFNVGHIIMGTGESAYITTGGPFGQYSFPIYTSFKENLCTGYLKVYPFTPALSKTCPYAKTDPDINTVTDQCYDYIASLNRCENPEKEDLKKFELQTTQCKNFMRVRLNYPSCVAHNRYTEGFTSKKWRIFLGQKQEMWASRREVITLYDKKGLIVDQISY
jgi:hypothetical protein